MMLRIQAALLPGAFLALLLFCVGCTTPGSLGQETAEGTTETLQGTAKPISGTTEPVEIFETLGEDDLEIVAVKPELTKAEERGLMIFRHYCAHCHGFDGLGDGQNSFGLETPPRDLLELELDGTRTDEELIQVITDGGATHSFSPLMPPWGETLEADRIKDLVALIHILPELEEPADDEEILSLDDDMGDFSL